MERIAICIVAFTAIIGSVSALNCTTLPDGSYEFGCRSYSKCIGGMRSVVDCPLNYLLNTWTVFNNKSGQCDDPANVSPPCGNLVDCKGKTDGQYADLDQNCNTWYTCLEEKFLGHNFCPSNTVFDESLKTCNWANAVPPPCGSYKG